MSRKSTKHLITRSILMLKIRNFLCKLTQSVKKNCNFFLSSLKKKNLLTAAKAPLCSLGFHCAFMMLLKCMAVINILKKDTTSCMSNFFFGQSHVGSLCFSNPRLLHLPMLAEVTGNRIVKCPNLSSIGPHGLNFYTYYQKTYGWQHKI